MSPVLRKGYVQANGALLSSAKTNYPRLVDFVQDNPSLLAADDTAWNSNKALYVYDDTNDTLRVPDATGRVLQGGASVQSVEAGLPNITGEMKMRRVNNSGSNQSIFISQQGAFTQDYYSESGVGGLNMPSDVNQWGRLYFTASNSNPLYSASNTVQPPALSLIAQIKY